MPKTLGTWNMVINGDNNFVDYVIFYQDDDDDDDLLIGSLKITRSL